MHSITLALMSYNRSSLHPFPLFASHPPRTNMIANWPCLGLPASRPDWCTMQPRGLISIIVQFMRNHTHFFTSSASTHHCPFSGGGRVSHRTSTRRRGSSFPRDAFLCVFIFFFSLATPIRCEAGAGTSYFHPMNMQHLRPIESAKLRCSELLRLQCRKWANN